MGIFERLSRAVPLPVSRVAPALVVTGAAAAFWRTAYPTITWWDSSSYSLAAATLGVGSSPGSLLLTLLGWVVTRFPSTLSAAHRLNLLAGALAAMTVGLVYIVTLRVLRHVGEAGRDDSSRMTAIGSALGALAFAFSATLWEYAVQFTPYVLTAVSTALILWTMMRWWEDADRPEAWRQLALLGLLFGLDFSVHRSNALLLPGVLAWILIRRARTLGRAESWLAGIGGLVIGLTMQLLTMPIAAYTTSPLNMFEPTTWARFWDYVSLAQVGGGFLVKLWPRNAACWSVQVADFVRALRDNFFHSATRVAVLGWLPALAGVLGLFALWRRDRRLAAAFTIVLFSQASMTVLYFNIPANYFRSLDRHYLPVAVTIAVAIGCGTGVAARWLAQHVRLRSLQAVALAVIALVPAAQFAGNGAAHDASKRYFTRDFAANALRWLPSRAIYFTVGDNDTFPLWYLQTVEGVRPDVRVVNLSLANASWYVRQLVRRDPTFPAAAVPNDSTTHPVRPIARPADTTVVIPVRRTAEQLRLPAGFLVPDSITVRPGPRVGADYLPADAVLLDIVRTNAWRDPLCFAGAAGPDGMGWLKPYARLEGLHWCIIPVPGVGVDLDLLRANLLERYEYRGFADPSVAVADMSRTIGALYLYALGALLDAERARGATDRCRDDARRILAAVPPARLGLSPSEQTEIEARCKTS
jgi:hypothetical protein